MGQAKNRAAEINELKKNGKLVKILAIRHCADGQQEFAYFGADLKSSGKNSKNALLSHICLKDWLHTPPAQAIAEYLVETQTFKMSKALGQNAVGFEINFYEADTDPAGRKTHSCRNIVVMNNSETAEEHFNKKIAELNTEEGRSVRTYA